MRLCLRKVRKKKLKISFVIQSIGSDGWWAQGPIAAEGTGLLGLRDGKLLAV